MCDTLVALGNSTADGSVLFAKNSDREPNEAHHLLLVPAANHAAGSKVKCTYIEVPQVEHTYAVLLAKPFWIWGAEMGANQHGVVIGNEAVFSRLPAGKTAGLIGMDFLRLALERGENASEALQAIIDLLETFGQSGNCGFTHEFYYHNSYLIADRQEAWVLETVGRQWAAEKVKDVRSISNALTIGSDWDRASHGLVDLALEKGWCKQREDFHYARCYSDPLYTWAADAGKRQACTTAAMRADSGKLTPQAMMQVLQSHHRTVGQGWSPDRGLLGADVCMHAGYGPVRGSQSVGSMVSDISAGPVVHWVTGTSAPCTSLFKPVWLDAGLPDSGPQPQGVYDENSLFWQHELLHRAIVQDYANRAACIIEERSVLQAQFLQAASELKTAPAAERFEFSQQCFTAASAAERRWYEEVRDLPIKKPAVFYSALAWKGFNRQAALPQD
jgi:dipeptidase